MYASSIEPIHPSIPRISAEDPVLCAWLAWMEVFRLRRPRMVEAALDIEQAA